MLGLAINAFAARLLNPRDAGTFFFAMSVVISGAFVTQLGLHRASVRIVAESIASGDLGRAQRAIRIILRIGFATALLVGLVLITPPTSLALQRLFPGTRIGDVVWAVSVAIVLRSLSTLRAETFRGLQDFRSATVFGGLDAQAVTILAFGGIMILLPTGGTLEVLLAIVALAWLPGLFAAGLILHRRTVQLSGPGTANATEVLSIAGPLFLMGVGALVVSQADLWIVGSQAAAEDIAQYGAALRLVVVVVIPLQIVNNVIPPFVAELRATDRPQELEQLLRTAATLSALPAVALALLFIVAGGPILGLIYGDFYSEGGRVLAILGIGFSIDAATGPCGLVLTITGNERSATAITLMSGAGLVIGTLLVVGPHGLTGVAAVAAIVRSTQQLASWFILRKKLGVCSHAGLGPALEAVKTMRKSIAPS